MNWLLGSVGGRVEAAIAGRLVVQGDLLADGGFAFVYRGSDARTGEELAIRRALVQDADALRAARYSVEMLEALPSSHPHIVRFLGASILTADEARAQGAQPVQQAVSLFELCSGGTLLHRLERALAEAAPPEQRQHQLSSGSCPCLPESEAVDVAGALASALEALHGLGIIHYDVKSENLLLGRDGRWKLGDFGSASRRTFELAGAPRKLLLEADDFMHGRTTPMYRPPEMADVYLRWTIGPKVDIFAAGCVLFATLTGVHPFPMDSTLGNIQAIVTFPAEADAVYSAALLRWTRRMLARQPTERPSAADLSQEVARFQSTGDSSAVADAAGAANAAGTGEPWVADFSMAPLAPPASGQADGVAVASPQAPSPPPAIDRAPSWVADFSSWAPAGPEAGNAAPLQSEAVPQSQCAGQQADTMPRSAAQPVAEPPPEVAQAGRPEAMPQNHCAGQQADTMPRSVAQPVAEPPPDAAQAGRLEASPQSQRVSPHVDTAPQGAARPDAALPPRVAQADRPEAVAPPAAAPFAVTGSGGMTAAAAVVAVKEAVREPKEPKELLPPGPAILSKQPVTVPAGAIPAGGRSRLRVPCFCGKAAVRD